MKTYYKKKLLSGLFGLFFLLTTNVYSIAQTNSNFPLFRVTGEKIDGQNSIQEEKMKKALQIFEKVMNDTSFQEELKTLVFYFDVEDDPNRNLSTLEIIKKIYDAKEHYTPEADNNAQIYWKIEKRGFWSGLFRGCSVIGYGEAGEKEITTYTCFYKKADLNELTGHIAHEWSHKLGFDHKKNNHSRRNETVPYAFGYLIRKHATKYVQ